jgi:hypothetical protein
MRCGNANIAGGILPSLVSRMHRTSYRYLNRWCYTCSRMASSSLMAQQQYVFAATCFATNATSQREA